MKNTSKLLSLESLRGIAALLVAIYHNNMGVYFNYSFFPNAWLMVDFFFVLSGFVIALNYQTKLQSFGDLYQFQKRRFLRLYPLHFLVLFIFIGFEAAKYIVEIKLNLVGVNSAFEKNDFFAILANLLLIQNFAISYGTFNVPSWSISAEFYTYAIFGIMMLGAKNSRSFLIALSISLILISGFFLNNIGLGTFNISGPLRCIYSFFIGVITYNIFDLLKLNQRISNSLLALFLLGLTAFVIVTFGSEKNALVFIPILFSLTILGVSSTQNNTQIIKFLSYPKLVYLGTISYGIYMIHTVVWFIFDNALRFGLNVPVKTSAEGRISLVIPNIYISEVVSLLGIATIVLFAHLSYKYLEKRFI